MEKKSIKDTGLHLLKKGQKGLAHAIFSRFGIIILLFAIQVVVFFSVLIMFQSHAPEYFGGGIILGFLFSIYIINTRIDPTAKLTWVILVMAFPVFGTLLYLYTVLEFGHRSLRQRVEILINSTRKKIPQEKAVFENFVAKDPGAASIAHYLQRTGCFPVFDRTDVSYLSIGEDMFDEVLRQLEKAKHFIFLEYFIIDEGIMWGKILEILARKVKEYKIACEAQEAEISMLKQKL